VQSVKLYDIGHADYSLVWQMQKDLFNASIKEKLDNKKPQHQLIVCEHPHVYTLGKSAKVSNLLLSESELKAKSIAVYDIERGGDITYHGPGQMVVYPIFDLEQLQIGVKKFVDSIEQCIINLLAHYGLEAERIDGRIGIWLGKDTDKERKIAAIGIKCSRHMTMHGLALNVNTDLNLFNHIIPCGIQDKAVSSMEMELGRKLDIKEVKDLLLKEFESIFEIKIS
jgi:lipoyl(octanoyl) transferase